MKPVNEKSISDLEQTIKNLQEELLASVARENRLIQEQEQIKQSFAEKLANQDPFLIRAYNDPNSTVGRILRLPRTCLRMITHPKTTLRNIHAHRHPEGNDSQPEIKPLFAPVQFFISSTSKKRLNLLVETLESPLLKTAIEMANHRKLSLRIITTSEHVSPLQFSQILKQQDIKYPQDVELYSSLTEAEKLEPFRLEVGKDELFLTTAWNQNEPET